MRNVGHKTWFSFALPGLWLVAAFLLGGGAAVLAGGQPATAVAANRYADGPTPDCTGEHHSPFFGSVVVVNSGEVICSNLTSFGGAISILGKVKGDIVAFGGNVLIDGQVDGNVTLYGGSVTIQNNAHVQGDIHVCGGHWTQGDVSQRHGSVFECTKSVGMFVLDDSRGDFPIWAIAWVVLGWLVTTLLPEHAMLVRTTIKSKMRRSLVLGLLSILLAPAVLAVLIALIISIPLAIIVSVGLVAAWALGTVAVGWLIGAALLKRFFPQYNARLLQVTVGLTVLALAGSLPYIGWLISGATGLIGLGAVLLSRFGTRLYSQPRQPLPL